MTMSNIGIIIGIEDGVIEQKNIEISKIFFNILKIPVILFDCFFV